MRALPGRDAIGLLSNPLTRSQRPTWGRYGPSEQSGYSESAIGRVATVGPVLTVRKGSVKVITEGTSCARAKRQSLDRLPASLLRSAQSFSDRLQYLLLVLRTEGKPPVE
jgi:hypothetical protein